MDAVPGMVILLAQKRPDADDVVAGWVGLGVLLLMVVAVVVLAFSLVKQLRKVNRAEEAGVYDEPPTQDEDASTTPAEDPSATPDAGDRDDRTSGPQET